MMKDVLLFLDIVIALNISFCLKYHNACSIKETYQLGCPVIVRRGNFDAAKSVLLNVSNLLHLQPIQHVFPCLPTFV